MISSKKILQTSHSFLSGSRANVPVLAWWVFDLRPASHFAVFEYSNSPLRAHYLPWKSRSKRRSGSKFFKLSWMSRAPLREKDVKRGMRKRDVNDEGGVGAGLGFTFTYRSWVAPCHSYIACHNSTLIQSELIPLHRRERRLDPPTPIARIRHLYLMLNARASVMQIAVTKSFFNHVRKSIKPGNRIRSWQWKCYRPCPGKKEKNAISLFAFVPGKRFWIQ